MRGADVVVRDLIRAAIGKIFDEYFSRTNTQQSNRSCTWGARSASTTSAVAGHPEELKQIQGLFSQLSPISVKVSDAPEVAVVERIFARGHVRS